MCDLCSLGVYKTDLKGQLGMQERFGQARLDIDNLKTSKKDLGFSGGISDHLRA